MSSLHVLPFILLVQLRSVISETLPESFYEDYGDYWDMNQNNQLLTQNREYELIGSFYLDGLNVERFAKSSVIQLLPQIIKRYDIIALSGIFDKPEIIIDYLHALVNNRNKSPYGVHFTDTKSNAVGVQFAIFYRELQYGLQDFAVYDDPDSVFGKPPVVAIMKHLNISSAPTFAIINVHSKISRVLVELNKLPAVVEWVKSKFSINDVLIVGPFMDGCNNVKDDEMKNVTLWNKPEYKWVIPRDMVTKWDNKQCSHDKIVVTGKWILNHTFTGSGNVFKFDKAYKTTVDNARLISTHYPVEIVVRSGEMDE